MSDEYNKDIARHYAAYRPALHLPILKAILEPGQKVSLGLDIGCGTGQSAIALTHFCQQVVGLEPSKAMLDRAIPHARIDYQHYDQQRFQFQDDYFDVITLAGSLFYAKSQILLDEVCRVGRQGAKLILYDFELLLEAILVALELGEEPEQGPVYNHQEDFSGLDQSAIQTDQVWQEQLSVFITWPDLAHLLLSVPSSFRILEARFGREALLTKVQQQLRLNSESDGIAVKANAYAKSYKVLH